MKRIVVICRAFCVEFMVFRWRKMAKDYPDLDITLIGDSIYQVRGWKTPIVRKLNNIEEDRFRYIGSPFRMNRLWRGGYAVKGIIKTLRDLKPDFIYLIGTETSDLTIQIVISKYIFLRKTKIAIFTMRGTDLPLHNINFRLRWRLLRSYVDAFFCHCPKSVEVLRMQGKIWQPIYMQTQVGVNIDIFKPNTEARKRIRNQLGVKENEYLFGSVSRINKRKGLLDMIDALPINVPWKFLMIGGGPDQKAIKSAVRNRGMEKQVLLPGYIEGYETVSDFINALDCSVLMSKTSTDYVDTFPLAVAQSMAVGIPVIVSDSGGLPYQVGREGIVVNEGDINGLHEAMEFVSGNPEAGKKIGEAMRKRLLNSFSVPHLNHCFYTTLKDILNNRLILDHMDQQNFLL